MTPRPRAGRIIVTRCPDVRDSYPWEVWEGWDLLDWFATHAEAINYAQKEARRG